MANYLRCGFLPVLMLFTCLDESFTVLRSVPGTFGSGLSMQHIRLDWPLEVIASTGGPSSIQDIRLL